MFKLSALVNLFLDGIDIVVPIVIAALKILAGLADEQSNDD